MELCGGDGGQSRYDQLEGGQDYYTMLDSYSKRYDAALDSLLDTDDDPPIQISQ